ncbi:MAG: ATP-dependent helicase [Candidatus Kerfeldbacteria bacterium]|nr:ATP-dependent helicase [Candidatus Kerfeldbacteria bacterium]
MNGGSPLDHPISKQLKSNVEKPSDIRHLHVATMEDEGVITAKEILSLVGNSGSTATSTASANEPLSYRDIAILVRANDHTETFIAALERFEIPYHVVSSKGLLFRSEIVDLLSYARLLDNYHEARAVWRVLNFPQWQIPPRDQSILMQTITRKGISAFDAILNARTISGLSENTLFVCNRIASLVERHATRAARTKPSQLFLSILQDTGYFEYLSHRSQTEEAAVREILENFEALLKMATHFERATPNATLKNFLQEIDLMMASGESGDLPATSQESPDAVSVMTAHAAKGLEFAYVFIGNLVDKRFPSVGRNDAIELPEALLKEILPTGDFHLQEERRLFYVACTRAKRGLVFVSAEDYGGLRKKKLSRFLVEAGLAATARKVPMPTGSVALPELGSKLPENLTSQHTPTLGKDSLPLPRTLSFTQMKAFETCPYQYRFAHLLKIPVPGRPTFSFGKTIHATLQEFFKRIQIKRKHPQTNLFGETNADASDAAPTLGELLEIYDSVFIDDWYDSPSQKQEYKERGRELLKIFYESHNGVFPNPKYLEKGFLVRVGEYGVRGFLDRADSVDGGLEIIDYKTGKPPASEHYLEKDQLNLYAIAANEVFHEKPARLTFWYLEGNKKYSFEPDESQIEKLREKISAIAKKIATSDFKATPGRHCRTCDFRDICEFRAK